MTLYPHQYEIRGREIRLTGVGGRKNRKPCRTGRVL